MKTLKEPKPKKLKDVTPKVKEPKPKKVPIEKKPASTRGRKKKLVVIQPKRKSRLLPKKLLVKSERPKIKRKVIRQPSVNLNGLITPLYLFLWKKRVLRYARFTKQLKVLKSYPKFFRMALIQQVKLKNFLVHQHHTKLDNLAYRKEVRKSFSIAAVLKAKAIETFGVGLKRLRIIGRRGQKEISEAFPILNSSSSN